MVLGFSRPSNWARSRSQHQQWVRLRHASRMGCGPARHRQQHPPTPGASPGTLSAYHSILERNRVRLAKLEAELEKRRQDADTSSLRRAELSELPSVGSHSRGSKYRPRIPRLSERDVAGITQNLNNSFMMMDSVGLMRPKTAEGAAVQLAAYLVGNPPAPDAPQAALHRVAIESLGILGERITPKAPAGAGNSPRHASGSRQCHSRSPDKSPWHGSGSRRRSPAKDARDDITQSKIDRARRRRAARVGFEGDDS